MIGNEADYRSQLKGRTIVEVVEMIDKSEDWNMAQFSLLKLNNYGQTEYAVLSEIGCSCWESGEGTVDMFPDYRSAKERLDELSRLEWY